MIVRETSGRGPAPRSPAKGKKEEKSEPQSFLNALNQAYGQMPAAAPSQDETAAPSLSGTTEPVHNSVQGQTEPGMNMAAGNGNLLFGAMPGYSFAAAMAQSSQALGTKGPGPAAGEQPGNTGDATAQIPMMKAGEGQPSFSESGTLKTAGPTGQDGQHPEATAFDSLKGQQAETKAAAGTKGEAADQTQQQETVIKTAGQEAVRKTDEKDDKTDSTIYLQEEPATADGEPTVIKIKVAEPYRQVNQEFSEKLSDTISSQLKAGNQQYEIKLDPEHLGSVEVKISVFEGRAVVELSCASHKTAELLSQNAKTIGALMEQHSPNQVSVEVRQNEEPQHHEQQGGHGHGQGQDREQQREQQNRSRPEENEGGNFAEQLRLGLFQV